MTITRIRLSRLCFTATSAMFAGGATGAHASQTHTIKPGDNLSSIARDFHVTVQDIVQANHLTNQDALPEGKKLVIPDPPKRTIAPRMMSKSAAIHGNRISVRIGPSVSERRVDMFDMGAPVVVTASRGDWFQVTVSDGREGWVRKDFIKLLGSPAPAHIALSAHEAQKHQLSHFAAGAKHTAKLKLAHASTHHASVRLTDASHVRHAVRNHFAASSHASHRKRRAIDSGPRIASSSDVVRTAVAYRGTPYHYGGTGRGGFDCSGFTSYVYRQKGVSLPHNAAAQYSHGAKIAKSELKPGDLVFFHCGRRGISHVGIFVGNGKFVHASSPRSGGVRVDSLSNGYYQSTFRGARRVRK